MRARTVRLSGFLLLAGVLGCNEDVTRPPTVAAVQVSPLESSVFVLRTVQLAASVRDANGTELQGRAVSWSSDNTAIATVDTAGVVTAVTPGAAIISATAEGHTGYATVRVAAPPINTGPAIWIASITSGGLPVTSTNVRGVIDVAFNVAPISVMVSRIEVMVDSSVVCSYAIKPSRRHAFVGSCTFDTTQTGPNGERFFANGIRLITVRMVLSSGIVYAQTRTNVILNNP